MSSLSKKIQAGALSMLALLCMPISQALTIYTASGTSGAMTQICQEFTKETGIEIAPVFASSSTLARQIIAGAPFDLYISANPKWMDTAQKAGVIDVDSRTDLLRSDLVLIAPTKKPFTVEVSQDFDFSQAFSGRLAMGEPASVPAGHYAKDALAALGWWEPMQGRLLPCKNVKVALRMVELGESDAGIVYRADAIASDKVEVIAVLPAPRPILFAAALPKNSSAQAQQFFAYLQSEKATAIFKANGFVPLKGTSKK